MENLELDVNALRHVVIHRLDDSCDSGEEDSAEGDEALERTAGDATTIQLAVVRVI